MARANNIADRFPGVKGLKTYAGALARIEKAITNVGEDFAYVIVQRSAGDFLPIAIIGPKTEHLSGPLCWQNICVTNA